MRTPNLFSTAQFTYGFILGIFVAMIWNFAVSKFVCHLEDEQIRKEAVENVQHSHERKDIPVR